MKRVGIVLLTAVALLVVFTLALAQLEARSAKHLLRVLTGEDVRGYFGSALEGAYAFTGDKPLFAVSSTGEVQGPIRTGQVDFHDGLLAEKPVLTIRGVEEGDLFGWTLSGGGDWNGDGIPDLAVGAPNSTAGGSPPGKVYVYLGGPEFGKSSAAIVTAGEKADGFGEAISLKHDINGDGLADLIVGAPRSHKAGATAGRAYVWYGKKEGSPAKEPDVEVKIGTTNDLFGTCIATGDLNGDGQADVAIGVPHDKLGGDWLGAVFVFHGGTGIDFKAPSQTVRGEGTAFQDQFGRSIAIVADQNGDGAAELAVGAPQVTVDGKQFGKVYLFYGGAKIASQANMTFAGPTEAGRFGQLVYDLGDINGDGKGDWAVHAEAETGGRGTIRLYYGGWEKEFYKFTGESVGDRLGNATISVGDFDANGSADILVGARWNDACGENAGRVYVLGIER
ncbi:FG-GAP repeat protein [bacterium]|nr:FG-GAP repeat protein [bacterium]MBU1982792.1 FG-GAP repeat protein [bacterium]